MINYLSIDLFLFRMAFIKKSDNAQVGVIVAILLAALLAIILVIIQVEYVPQWMNDKEAGHMETVRNQFAVLKSNIDTLCIAGQSTPMSSPIKLGSERISYFASSRSFGSLNILSSENSNFNIQITSPDGKIEETFSNSSVTNGTIENVTQISYFELVINLLGNQEFQVFVRDGESELGNMTVSLNSYYNITLTVNKVDEAEPIFNQSIATGISGGNYRINLLNPDYKLYRIIGSNNPYNVTSSIPFTLQLNASGGGTYEIEGKRFNDTSFPKTYSVGTIKYSANNAYFPDQSYLYESGAVMINQSVGSAMVFPPSFSSPSSPIQRANISLSIINVTSGGGKDSASGYGTYSVKTDFGCISQIHLRGTYVNFTINTDYPEAWFRYLNKSFNISHGYIDINVSRTSNSVKMYAHAIRDQVPVDLRLTIVEISARIE